MKWKRWRARFGISAPRLAIRPHVPWYWRGLTMVVVLAIALALAHWVYDAGRSLAGFEWDRSEKELNTVREELFRLREENEQLRKVSNASESRLQIEQTAQERLTEQARQLEKENGQLKEELAVFESLASGSAKMASAGMSRLAVENGGGGNYRYRVLLTAGSNQGDRELAGLVQLAVTGQQGGKPVMLTFPRTGEKEVRVSFRRFLRHSGSFQAPPDLVVKEVEARLLVGGAVLASTKIAQ